MRTATVGTDRLSSIEYISIIEISKSIITGIKESRFKLVTLLRQVESRYVIPDW